jgi:type II secretory pathway pseudopilin PulG
MPTGKSVQSGFTYLYVLMLIALIGMGLATAGTLWRTDAQRAREAELLFIGDQYRQAIRSYYELDPAQPRLPQSIDELLEDNRRPDTVRHLRRAWRDPLSGGELALIVAPDSHDIVGVHSPAQGRPFKQAGFAPADETLAGAARYAEWRFVFVPPPPLSAAALSSPSSQNSPQTPSQTSSDTPKASQWTPAPRAGYAGRHP